MQIEGISTSLTRNAEGIYVTPESQEVSYPTDGHTQCFQIEDRSFWFKHRNECIAAMIARFPYAGTLIDIGGGNGFVAQKLVEQGHDVILLEPGYMGALNAHRVRGLKNVVCATIEDADFAPRTFGAIGMFDVIEHIDDDSAFLSSIVPLLQAGGHLYLTVPCHDWLWSQADVDAGHFRRHTLDSVRALLSGLFEIDYLSYFFKPLVLPQFLLRALPYRIGMRRNQILSSNTEHGTDNGLSTRLISRLLEKEVGLIAGGQSITVGASCLVAAHLR